MDLEKVINISDTVHGTILISSLESSIISTTAFNRLHNILQNSTVYLTYPSNQTKRFEHSLGVMTLGGKMFYHSIANANDKIRNNFLEDINTHIINLLEDRSFVETLELKFGDTYLNIIDDWKSISIDEPFYKLRMPKTINNENNLAYLLSYQSIRIAALLHDIGHPPFSHITEFALEKIWNTVAIKEKKTEREMAFIENLSFFDGENKTKLHEQIGNRIVDRLIRSVITSFEQPKNENEAKLLFLFMLTHHFVNKIFAEEDKIFEDMHRIIDSSLDCDRLDYVTRDMKNSGLDIGSIEYDRIVNSMKLFKNGDDYVFAVNIKNLNSVEDFFNRRWNLYQNIIFHHRVVKTDSLLGNAIVNLGLHYLGKEIEESEKDKQIQEELDKRNVLSSDISGLWGAVKEAVFNKDYFNALIQWDDAWLLSVLRKEFFTTYQNKDDNSRYQLEELLSNKKYYRSMIKKLDAFQELDKVIAENFTLDFEKLSKKAKDFVIPSLIQLKKWQDKQGELINPVNENVKKIRGEVHKIKEVIPETASDHFNLIEDLLDKNNLILGPLLEEIKNEQSAFFTRLLKTTFFKVNNLQSNKDFEDIVEKTICDVAKNQFGAEDCLVVFKNIKTGLDENLPYVYQDDQLSSLDLVSRIKVELSAKEAFFPLFFIYIHEQPRTKINHGEFIKAVGIELSKSLAKSLDEKIHKQYNEMTRENS